MGSVKAGFLASIFLFLAASVQAEQNLLTLKSNTTDNVEVIKLATDVHTSQFLIFIRQAVPNHIHEHHSESIYVLEGTGVMRVADDSVAIKSGDYIHLVKGTVHGVQVTSKVPLKVLSIQAPEFHGADRIWVKD